MSTIKFQYIFYRKLEEPISYDIEIDETTLTLVPYPVATRRQWTRLESNTCENCPLNPAEHPYCPLASNISQVVEEFKDHTSYDPTTVTVIGPERTYSKEVPLQYGIFSILGLIMATSECPHMTFLKPMARFHLPFASAEETIVRTVSLFLLRQYLRSKTDSETSFDLAKLDDCYAKVNRVNKGMVKRIRSIAGGDADANAIVILHSLATLLSQSLSENLAEIAPIFADAESPAAPV